MKIFISLRFFATLSARMPADADRYAVTAGATVADVLSELGVSSRDAKLVFVNNKRVELTWRLSHGDRVGVFPPVGGG